MIREQFDPEDWMAEEREVLAAHFAEGFAQAQRGELMDGGVAIESLGQRRFKQLTPVAILHGKRDLEKMLRKHV